MPSTVEQLNPSRVKLTVEIPFADLKPHLDKAYREIASQVSIPGFRKGKVPNLVIDQRFGRAAVLQEAINAALPAAYESAIVEASVIPLGEPDIEVTKLEDGDVVEFTAETDVRPEITVPEFGTLAATVEPLRAVDAEVEERIDMLRRRFATSTEVDRAAADGDQVKTAVYGDNEEYNGKYSAKHNENFFTCALKHACKDVNADMQVALHRDSGSKENHP